MPLPHDRKRRGRGALQAMTLSFLGVFLYITIIRPLYNEPAVSAPYEAHGLTSSLDELRDEDCVEIGRLDAPEKRISTAPVTHSAVIPLLATNLDFDPENYLSRLVQGWADHPAKHKLVVTGGCDKHLLSEVRELRERHRDLTVYRHPEPLGCAAGWNKVLEFMQFNSDVEWAMVFNTDVYVPPGALDKLAVEIWREYRRDPRLCRGFFDVTAGQDAVVFVLTRHGLEALGRFDENIYPAYFEDHDMDLRHNRTTHLCSPVARFKSATLHHGPLEQKEYVSGTSSAREKMRSSSDQGQAAAAKLLSRRLEIGFRSSQSYLGLKWGCDKETQEVCVFEHPFNDPSLPASYWRLDWKRRRCITESVDDKVECEYGLDRPRWGGGGRGGWGLLSGGGGRRRT